MNSREFILDAVETSAVNKPHIGEDPVVFINNESEDLVEEYILRAKENKAFVIKSSNLKKDIKNIIEKENVSRLIRPKNIPVDIKSLKVNEDFVFDMPVEEFKERLFDYDVSIIEARKGVSSHGVFCVTSSKEQPRLLSLTPKVCIVLLKKENIVKSISIALNEIKKEDQRLPTNIVFVCGPSRTSDIELTPVLGVHGSQVVYVLVY
ncbi:NAD-independent L-lactate dehydrogenase LldEFG, subunit LldG [Campylobacter blaseri]|uniref:Lactate utilization protein C n=1 Tax=Campylobacter blaseri TaxID=2042961 RepID=A0A2P8R120_9BACT|nr:LUD domain-containing protein [Campylobacter blaseri]PSM52196.1 lactate utilization protein C [Campylobacter blaseri]PSM53962.1 lactate utilization protein C [Campylobacter blaseri]QKF85399.1 NAD-independent L-lactate dehydrogenase LldEFG, subunit LldG [Campylobacter blaseri]